MNINDIRCTKYNCMREPLEGRIVYLERRIAELMLNYCPDEMTPEQIENWEKHRRPADIAYME